MTENELNELISENINDNTIGDISPKDVRDVFIGSKEFVKEGFLSKEDASSLANTYVVGIYDSGKEPDDYDLYNPTVVNKFILNKDGLTAGFTTSAAWGSLVVTQDDIDNNEVCFVCSPGNIWTKVSNRVKGANGTAEVPFYDPADAPFLEKALVRIGNTIWGVKLGVSSTSQEPSDTATDWEKVGGGDGDMKWSEFDTNIKGRAIVHLDWTGFDVPDPGDPINYRWTEYVPVKAGDVVNIKAYSAYAILSVQSADKNEIDLIIGNGWTTIKDANYTITEDGYVIGITTNLASQNYSMTITPISEDREKNIYYGAFSEIQDLEIDLRQNVFKKQVDIGGAAAFTLVDKGFFGNVNAFKIKATSLTLPSSVVVAPESDLFLNTVYNTLYFYNEFDTVYCLIKNV